MAELTNTLQTYAPYFIYCFGAVLLLAIALLIVAVRQMQKIDIPENADLTTTLLAIPIVVVIGIDLLDLALDFLALPIVWVLLNRMGLRALRNISAVEALVPFTQPIPTLTLAWIAVRAGVRF
ncbi:MAG: hypothetical protein ACPG8W_08465 [Candidatus Promineifilaceae bacterium]